jgi:ferrochelatase
MPNTLATDSPELILLTDLGAPESPIEYRHFLRTMFRDPHILPLPAPLRYLIAGLIERRRAKPGWVKYQTIQGSPLKPTMRAIASALEEMLNEEKPGATAAKSSSGSAKSGADQPRILVRAAYSYAWPEIHESLAALVRNGVRRITVVPLHPHASRTTSGSVERVLRRLLPQLQKLAAKVEAKSGAVPQTLDLLLAAPFSDHPLYLDFWQRRIKATCKALGLERPHLLLSAHSIPESFVQKFADPYPAALQAHGAALGERLGLKWSLAYQSAEAGRQKWLGPTLAAELRHLGGEVVKEIAAHVKAKRSAGGSQELGVGADVSSAPELRGETARTPGEDPPAALREILILPVSFLTENVETRWDLDSELLPRWQKFPGMRVERLLLPDASNTARTLVSGLRAASPTARTHADRAALAAQEIATEVAPVELLELLKVLASEAKPLG